MFITNISLIAYISWRILFISLPLVIESRIVTSNKLAWNGVSYRFDIHSENILVFAHKKTRTLVREYYTPRKR